MEIYGSEVDQYLSAILSHMVAGNFRFFFLIIHHIYINCWFPLYRWSVMEKQVTSTPPIPGNGGGSGYLYLHY